MKMSDLISRHDAIDAWKEDFKGFINSLDMPRDDYKGIMEYIDEVPSAQQWIPCSERLPEKNGEYIVTTKYYLPRTGDTTDIDIIEFNDEGWDIWKRYEVLAWMPLPKAYEGEDR